MTTSHLVEVKMVFAHTYVPFFTFWPGLSSDVASWLNDKGQKEVDCGDDGHEK